MPDANNVPKISAAPAMMGNLNLNFVAYAEPTVFPHGLQLILMVPGQINPVGSGPVPRGSMLAVVMPPIPPLLLEEAKKAWRFNPLGPGEVRPPGAS